MGKYVNYLSLKHSYKCAWSVSWTGILKNGKSGSGKNPMFFSVSGSCKVNSGAATLSYKITSGWAKLNGKNTLQANPGPCQWHQAFKFQAKYQAM